MIFYRFGLLILFLEGLKGDQIENKHISSDKIWMQSKDTFTDSCPEINEKWRTFQLVVLRGNDMNYVPLGFQ